MAKQLHYLLIAESLTGDSKVYFYATPELAEQAYKIQIQPLIDACMNNYYDTEEQDVFYYLGDGKNAVRFNSGQLDALDELIGENNVYFEWNTVTVDDDVTHYIANLSEYVDESSLTFYNKDAATTKYNDLIDEGIQIAKDHHGYEINRHDQSTWHSTENGTLFSEPIDTTINYSDAFFGFDDVYWTIRCGEIDVMDKKEYTVIASGVPLKRTHHTTLTIDPTNLDTLNMLADFKSYAELIEYMLEEEEAEWEQRNCKCNIIDQKTLENIIKQDEEEQANQNDDEEEDDEDY